MTPRSIVRMATAAALVSSSLAAHAATFTFSGDLTFNTDIAQLTFSLDATGSNVRIWTDSWQSGLNFDPVAAVWSRSGADYTLISEVDDDDTIDSGQGSFDAGLSFGSLAAGEYLVTVAASPNYATGPTLSAGFAFNGQTPIAIADWSQPGSNINTNDQKGTLWRINLDNVTQAAPVPEPSLWLLMALGVAFCGARARQINRVTV